MFLKTNDTTRGVPFAPCFLSRENKRKHTQQKALENKCKKVYHLNKGKAL